MLAGQSLYWTYRAQRHSLKSYATIEVASSIHMGYQSMLRRSPKDRSKPRLWQQRDFLRLWAAQIVSLSGTQVTVLALPTVAILALRATPVQVGALATLQWLGFLVVGPFAGVIADRLPRRRILVVADITRMLALGSVPVAFALGRGTLAHLFIVAAITSVGNVFFDVGYQSYVPALVERSRLIEGNARLALADGAARVGGPALGGILIQLVGAAWAIAADAASYLVSAVLIGSIQTRESVASVQRPSIFTEMREGVTTLLRQPTLRTLALVSTLQNFSGALAEAVVLLFAYRVLRLPPGIVGVALALGSVGFSLGAANVTRANAHLGIKRTLIVSSLLGGVSYLLIPLGLLGVPALAFAAWRLLFGLSLPTWNVNVLSLRQAVIPERLQGRVAATLRTMGFGALAIGPLVGGLLSAHIGLAPTILVGGILYLVSTLPLLAPGIRLIETDTPS
jgi:MFS family permease